MQGVQTEKGGTDRKKGETDGERGYRRRKGVTDGERGLQAEKGGTDAGRGTDAKRGYRRREGPPGVSHKDEVDDAADGKLLQ
jgi:hypothetical protein